MMWFINTYLLAIIFGKFNQPYADKAREGAIRLYILGGYNVEKWLYVIRSFMTKEEFNNKILNQEEKYF